MARSREIAERALDRLRLSGGAWVERYQLFDAIWPLRSNRELSRFHYAITLLREMGWDVEARRGKGYRLASLKRRQAARLPRAWRTSSALRRLKEAFFKIEPGQLLTLDDLALAVYGDSDSEPEWSTSIIRVLICNARKEGFPIVTVRGYTRAPRRQG